MKNVISVIGLISFLLTCGDLALAGEKENAGAGQTGTSISLGYNGRDFSYQEIVNGSVLDKDTGWLDGGFFELRSDSEIFFTRITFDVTLTNSATYKGALQDGTPLTMKTREKIYEGDVSVGYKAWEFGTTTVSPYVGLGYWDWIRGQNNLPNYREEYTWWYVAAGINLACRLDKLLLGLDAAAELPISPEMSTNIAGQTDDATFDIKPRVGYRVEVPMNYTVHQGADMNVFILGTPYYQRWNIGASDQIVLTQNGIPVATAFEPQSRTDIYGFRLGIGLNF
jgi:hypothetical protein